MAPGQRAHPETSQFVGLIPRPEDADVRRLRTPRRRAPEWCRQVQTEPTFGQLSGRYQTLRSEPASRIGQAGQQANRCTASYKSAALQVRSLRSPQERRPPGLPIRFPTPPRAPRRPRAGPESHDRRRHAEAWWASSQPPSLTAPVSTPWPLGEPGATLRSVQIPRHARTRGPQCRARAAIRSVNSTARPAIPVRCSADSSA